MNPPAARTVLIVEDAEVCSATLEVALDGLIVHSVGSAEAALAILAHTPVNALVTDFHLPRMSGLDLVIRAREIRNTAQLAIVVISGDAHPDTPGRLLAAGADAFFAKPYSPLAVRQKLEELMHGH